MRAFLLAVVLVFVVFFVFTRLAEVQAVADTLQRGDWRWIALAFLVCLAWIQNVGAKLRAILRALGESESAFLLSGMVLVVNLVSTVTPTAGVGGVAYFMSRLRQRGHPLGRAASAAALYLLYDHFASLVVIGLGLIVLIRRNQLAAGEILASVFLVSFAATIAFFLYLGMRSAEQFGNALVAVGDFGNRLLRPFTKGGPHFDTSRSREFAHDFASGLDLARRTRGGLITPAALALCNKAFQITILFLMFLAFEQPFSPGTLIAAFGINALFSVASPTPGGLGFVEGAMTLVMASNSIPLASATVVTLAYRGVTFWFPLLLGFIALRWEQHAGKRLKPAL
jgi:uncharacterized protein (TIRG00374 family)